MGQLAFLVIMGGLVAVARRYVNLGIGVPGHTGVLWMFLLVYGRGQVNRHGAGALIGISAALWGVPLGLKQTLAYNALLYTSVGVAADMVAAIPAVRLWSPLGGLLAGAIAHSAKYGFILVHAKALALPKKFLLVGVLESFGLHLAFGALGGLAAGVVLWMMARRGRREEQRE